MASKQTEPQKPKDCNKCGRKYIYLFRDKYCYEYLWDSLHEYEQRFLLTAGPVEIDKTRHKKHLCNRRKK